MKKVDESDAIVQNDFSTLQRKKMFTVHIAVQEGFKYTLIVIMWGVEPALQCNKQTL